MVPENLSVSLSEGRDGQSQATRIGADEEIHMILGQKAQDVLLREARPAPVIEDEQSERAARPCEPQRKSARFGDVIEPQLKSVEGLLPLQPERPAEGQGHPGQDLGTESHLELQRTPPRRQVSYAHAARNLSKG